MKVILKQEILKEGVGIIERIAQKTISLPILQNTLIKSEGNFFNLTTTNLEIGINWWTLAKVEIEGQIAVPTRLFSTLISFLPNKLIKMERKDLLLDIECDSYRTELLGQNPDEFPIIPIPKEGEKISIDSQTFCQGLTQVVDISSLSVARPEISGIYLLFQKDLVKTVATDSFRLGEKKLFLKTPLTKEYALILPKLAAKEVINIFGEKEGNIQIYFSPNQILFESQMLETAHPKVQLVSKLIEGEYPNYEAIIPKKYETQIVLLRSEFLNQIKSASLFSGKINEVRLKINPKKGELEINSQSPDFGRYQSFLPAKIKGKEIEISFNHRFLIDGLFQIKSPEIIFELTGEGGPAVLKPTQTEDYLYVVMPIKTP